MIHWLNHQHQTLKLVLARMRNNLSSTFMICLVVGVAMCLPSLFYLGVDNLSRLTDHIQDETEISVFLRLDASAATIKAIDAILAKNPDIKHYHLVTRDEAWQQLQAKAQNNNAMDDVISKLEKNPLPDAFFIQAKSADPEKLKTLKNNLQNIAGVEQALLNAEWAQRLATLLSLGKQLILFVAILLAMVILVIIGNTVRMQILAQQNEIEVSYLIGASDSFIRTPFLYAGVLYGLFGGLSATLMTAATSQILNHSIAKISQLYNSDFSLALFNTHLFLGVILAAMGIGWLGSYLAVTRAIAAIKAQ